MSWEGELWMHHANGATLCMPGAVTVQSNVGQESFVAIASLREWCADSVLAPEFDGLQCADMTIAVWEELLGQRQVLQKIKGNRGDVATSSDRI